MAAKLGTMTYDVLLRPAGSTAAPTVVGQIIMDLDAKVPVVPPPIPPLPDPKPAADIKEGDR